MSTTSSSLAAEATAHSWSSTTATGSTATATTTTAAAAAAAAAATTIASSTATTLASSASKVVALVERVQQALATSSTAAPTPASSSGTSTSSTAATPSTTFAAASSTHAIPSSTTRMLNVGELSSSLQHFGFVDYFVFVLMLVVCAIIGFYFGFIEKKKKKNKKHNLEERRGSVALDYLVGGRKMKVFPVSLSLVASFVSGISLLGTSTEIYVYGTQYAFILLTLVTSGVISWYVFLPVFCNLQLTSTYEYFEMRFDKRIRLFGSVLFSIGTIFWLPIVIYVPALAFNQVTGINIHVITPVVCIVCIFYTCVGGLKAVVWTDVIQTIVMVGAIILVIIKGTIDVGGMGVVWQRNLESTRIEVPAMTWDPTVRVSMLSVFVGSTLFYTQVTAGNQVIMQRYLSLPSLKEAKSALIYFTVGVTLLSAACFYNGLLIFATYYDCDPLSTKLAKVKDQLVPLLVMDTLGVLPGMPGLFVAGVFSAALSSLSTGLNSLTAVFLEDYIKPVKKRPLTERQTAIVMRVSVVVIGVLCVGLVFVVERMGTVLQLSMTLGSTTSGPLLGLFLIGLLLPWINGKYFELRFGREVRYFGSILFIVGMILYLPVAVYVPALTFNQVSGISIHIITPVVCLVCTFYTCVGGLKAVIWTDVVQSFVMYGSVLAICIKGTIDVGGLGVVLQRNAASGRLNAPDLTWDPTVRLSMAAVLIGGTLHKIQSTAVNQISIQRFLSLPTYKQAQQTMLLFSVLLVFLLLCCCYVGLVVYATYYDCDPLSTKLTRASDQLPSLLMMRTLGAIPGLPGVFVAGVFSAALSSLSTGLNSLSCVISQDVVNLFVKRPLTERQTAIMLRLIVVFFGVVCIALVGVVEKLGMVLQLASMTSAVTMGPLLGVYAMGVCLPWMNGKSALTGCVVSFATLSWICANAQIGQMHGEIRHPKMPVSVEGCEYTYDNATAWHEIHEYKPSTAEERNIYHLSFLWYTASGAMIAFLVAGVATLFFGTQDLEELDPLLITPFMRRFLPKKAPFYCGSLEDIFNRKCETETAAEVNAFLEKSDVAH